MTKPQDFYWTDPKMARSHEENARFCQNKSGNWGCVFPPLLKIPLKNIVVDELHLLLRITGIVSMTIQTGGRERTKFEFQLSAKQGDLGQENKYTFAMFTKV